MTRTTVPTTVSSELHERQSPVMSSKLHKPGFSGFARRTVGICLLLVVVVLWTASNFLASVCWILPYGFLFFPFYLLLTARY